MESEGFRGGVPAGAGVTLRPVTYLYGDSTRFPHAVNYIGLCEGAVECAVTLLSLQHDITTTLDRAKRSAESRQLEQVCVASMVEAVSDTLSRYRQQKTARTAEAAERIIEQASRASDEWLGAVEREAQREASRVKAALDRMHASGQSALERFVLRHDLPGTTRSIRLEARGRGCMGRLALDTPLGVRADVELEIPPGSPWSAPLRVGDLLGRMEVRFPRKGASPSKGTAVGPVRVDRLFVARLLLGESHLLVDLRKGPTSGPGFQLHFERSADEQITVQQLDPSLPGPLGAAPVEAEFRVPLMSLYRSLVQASSGLFTRRRAVASATLDGAPLDPASWLGTVARRLIDIVSPVVAEIAARSGAAGELVLRRDTGERKREELYVTTAALEEKVLTLPPECRSTFAPLGLMTSLPPEAVAAPSL